MGELTDYFTKLGNKQRDQRVRRFFVDQHGRRWFAWADKDNQRPIGEFVLADLTGAFQTPPWVPAMTYIQWGDHDTLDFAWDYTRLADELAGVTAGYYDEASKLARAIKVEIPQVGGPVVPEILAIIGPPPLSPEIPLACEAGQAWLLGRIGAPEHTHLKTVLHQGRTITSTLALDTIRERVAAMVAEQQASADATNAGGSCEANAPDPTVVTYKDFIGAAMRKGMSMAEAATAWKAHRDNLAVA